MRESPAMAGFDGTTVKRALEIARLAPSAHNTQPWRVSTHEGRLVISVDPRRHLAHSDPLARDLDLALGGFVEAITIGLANEGIAVTAADAPRGSFAALACAGERDRDPRSASLLRRRQSSRLPYSPRPLESASVEALAAAAKAHGLRLHAALRGTDAHAKLEGMFYAATRESWLDARAVSELRRWLRFDPEGARPAEDGLSTHCLGLGTLDALGLLLAVRESPWRAAGKVFLAPLLAEALAKSETREVEQAPLVGVLVADREGAASAGAGLLRVWLAATELGLALHPISVLLDRRGWEVARHLGVSTGRLMFAFRMGRSAPPPRSGRLPIERFARI